MKKKFGIITAILICVALLLVVTACSGSGLKGVDDKKIEAKVAEIDAVLDAWMYNNSTEKQQDLSKKLTTYLLDNADTFAIRDESKNDIKPEQILVNYNKGQYTVEFTWKSGGTLIKTFTKTARTATYAPWAGSYQDIASLTPVAASGKMGVIDNIINAAFKEANNVISDSVSGQFGVEGMIGVSTMGYNYGIEVKGNLDLLPRAPEEDGEALDNAESGESVSAPAEEKQEILYGEGPNETEFSILLKNGSTGKVLGGFYYENATEDEDCNLYFQYLDKDEESGEEVYGYKYINYAILNQLFEKLELPFRKGKEAVLSENGGLSGVFKSLKLDENMSATVSSLISKLVDAYKATANGKTTYIMDINFGALLSELSKKFGGFKGKVKDVLSGIPYLEDLDIKTMHGLLGRITIAATLDANNNLTAFEISVNVPECTFYFTADESENAAQIKIPAFSFAIYAKDFNFDKDLAIEDVIPEEVKDEAVYFSPANVNLQGDLYLDTKINDKAVKSTYRYHLVTEVNPFKPSQAKASFTIKETKHAASDNSKAFDERNNTEFLKIVYEQSTQTIYTSGSVYDVPGVSKYTITDLDDFKDTLFAWLGKTENNGDNGLSWTALETVPYITDAKNLLPSAKAFLDNELASYILNYYYNHKTGLYLPGYEPEEDEDEEPAIEIPADDDEDEDESGDDLTDDSENLEEEGEGPGVMDMIKGYFDGGMAILDKVRTYFVIDAAGKSLKVEVTNEDIDAIAQDIATLIGAEFDTITDPSEVKVYVNTTDPAYKNAIYVKVVYGGDTYEVTLALTRDEDDEVETLSAKFLRTLASGRTYDLSLVLNLTEETLAIDYVIKASATATTEEPGSFHTVNMNTTFNWGDKNWDYKTKTGNLELYDENEKASAGDIFAGESQEENVASVLVGGIMDLANNELVYPYAKMLGRFVVRQITAD